MNKKLVEAVPFSITGETIFVCVDGVAHTVHASDVDRFFLLRDYILDEDWEQVRKHASLTTEVITWAQGKFYYKDGQIFHGEDALPAELGDAIMRYVREGTSVEPFLAFWDRLRLNPSMRSVEQLYRFLEHNSGFPLTEDGYFVAYKGVATDYLDCHSGTISNVPGTTVELPRNKISDDPALGCHFGLHVGAYEYAETFGGRTVAVKVDPMDVVCVPYDCSHQKMRVCKYTVLRDCEGKYDDGAWDA
jgi:hypothetical protein